MSDPNAKLYPEIAKLQKLSIETLETELGPLAVTSATLYSMNLTTNVSSLFDMDHIKEVANSIHPLIDANVHNLKGRLRISLSFSKLHPSTTNTFDEIETRMFRAQNDFISEISSIITEQIPNVARINEFLHTHNHFPGNEYITGDCELFYSFEGEAPSSGKLNIEDQNMKFEITYLNGEEHGYSQVGTNFFISYSHKDPSRSPNRYDRGGRFFQIIMNEPHTPDFELYHFGITQTLLINLEAILRDIREADKEFL